jgi:hypothetical protein
MCESGVMDAPRTIHCDSVWDALVLRRMLEEQGVQVGQRDEGEVLSIVASGALDTIKAAVAQLSHEFPNSSPVVIEGEDRAELAVTEGEDRAELAVTEGEDRAEEADTVKFVATEPFPAILTSSASGIPEEVSVRLDIDVQPEPATAAPANHTMIPTRPPAEQRPDQQTRQDEEAASPEKAPVSRGNAQASPEKAQAGLAKALIRSPEPKPPEAPARPPKAATSARMRRWLRLNWWIAVLVLVWLSLAAYNLVANSR